MLFLQPTLSGQNSTQTVRRHSLGRLMHSSTALLLFVVAALIIILAFLILFHHNLNATKGYKLRSLEHARSQLILEQEVLNMQIAKSQSLETLQSDPQILAMKKPGKVNYAQSNNKASKGITEAIPVVISKSINQ